MLQPVSITIKLNVSDHPFHNAVYVCIRGLIYRLVWRCIGGTTACFVTRYRVLHYRFALEMEGYYKSAGTFLHYIHSSTFVTFRDKDSLRCERG